MHMEAKQGFSQTSFPWQNIMENTLENILQPSFLIIIVYYDALPVEIF